MPTQEEIDIYEELRPKIASVRDTIKALSSKKPDETLNLFKIRRINILIAQETPYLRILNRTMISILSQRMTYHPIAMCF